MTVLLLALLLSSPDRLVVRAVEARTGQADSLLVIRTARIARNETFTPAGFGLELAEAVRRVYGLGLFRQVTADTAQLADGVTVTFNVVEYPRLARLKFSGNRRVKLKDLESRTKATPGEVLTDRKLFEWRREVLDLYKEKGFLLVTVEPDSSPPDTAGQVEITFQIEEGDQVRIRSLTFEGNQALSEKQLRRKLHNKPRGFLRRGRLAEDEFIKDLDRVVDLYKRNGYLDAKVLDYDMSFTDGWASIVITVVEGRQYYFGQVTFEGDSVIPRPDIEAVTGRLVAGRVYDTELAQAALADIHGLYSEEGYIYAQVVPTEDLRGDSVDIHYEIIENDPALVRLVHIEGNDQTHDKVIRREVNSLPGYRFRRSEVMRSQRDIFNLGFFEDVQLDYRRAGDDGTIDLIYRVKEKGFFGTVGAGVTYSGPDGITGYLELQQPNLFGRGQRANIKLERGGKLTNIALGFSEPWLLDTPTSAGADVSHLSRRLGYRGLDTDTFSYTRQELGGGLSFSRPLPLDYSRAYLGLRLVDNYVPPASISLAPADTHPIYEETVHRTAFIPSLTLTRDSRDYIFNPLSGSAVTYGLATSIGDIRYHRHTLDVAQYFPLFWKFGLMGRVRLGYIDGLSRDDKVPLSDRFSAGGTGPDGIRGYGDRSIGPYQGGKALALFSTEFKLRLSRELSFLAFADAGNAWNTIGQVNLSDLKRGAGVGVRLEIPMLGLLGFDFGYGFDREDGGRWEPHFQVGRTF